MEIPRVSGLRHDDHDHYCLVHFQTVSGLWYRIVILYDGYPWRNDDILYIREILALDGDGL